MCSGFWGHCPDSMAANEINITRKFVFSFDLQLFGGGGGEKTELPTPKRKQEARKKGQVPHSKEINSAVVLLAAFFTLRFYGPTMFANLKDLFYLFYAEASHPDVAGSLWVIVREVVYSFLIIILPLLVVVAITGVLVNVLQVGPIFSTESLSPKLSKLNPLEGFKRIFSKRTLVELVKSLLKISMIIYMLYTSIRDEYRLFPDLMLMDVPTAVSTLAMFIFTLAVKVAVMLLILAVFDLFFQRWQHTQDLKMSKKEIKDEYKQMEGDPQIKSKIREKQRQLAMGRMMQNVPGADVVITNPTHLAIALLFQNKKMSAPMVVAKGQDRTALRIKEIAKENDVPIVENKPLAQALYKTTELGQMIPTELYNAVAEVLAFVYRLKKKNVG